jgi:hypothetical protein
MMNRGIRIDYRFTFEGKEHYGNDVLVGDTIESKTPINELRSAAVCDALELDADAFDERWGEPWGWSENDWSELGFTFEWCEEL